ncbi:MAG: acyl-CoA thioesterase [Bdellovibrionales bacterium]|nr:acyl-CoA thioesterase [Bdellovibrionales bacterium]
MLRFTYPRRVAFYETDLAKVVHHATYLKYLEEARVDWMRQNDLLHLHAPEGKIVLAVLETQVQHLLPAYFNDVLRVELQVRLERSKIRFRYVVYSDRFQEKPIALGETLHFPLNESFKPTRLPEALWERLEKEIWTEIWP